MDIQIDDIKRKRFLWGVCLARTPFLFLIIPAAIDAFNGIAKEKATGLAAVAGGLVEFFSTFGLAAVLVFEWRQSSCCCGHFLGAARCVLSSQ